ncbi:MAG: glycosyltransferase [Saprospiraceae bacterium]|nr:glycosyltransferase [Saprospiraceae bacterium]
MITTGLEILVFLFTLYQCFLWILIYSRATQTDKRTSPEIQFEPVTVVICAHKVAENMSQNLYSVLTQQYPHYEAVIINDGPDPDLQQLLRGIQEKFANIQVIDHIKTSEGKKAALTKGIKSAKYEWILLTDSDCRPSSNRWIHEMMTKTQNEKNIIIGFSPYDKKENLLNQFIRFEAVINAIQYFSMARIGMPYMAVGRNMMYHKSIFKEEKLRTELTAGDDDLLINSQANSSNTGICLNPDSFVFTEAKNSWKEYFFQRMRHYNVSNYYKFSSQVFLLSHFISFFGLWLCAILLFINGKILIPLGCLIFYIGISSAIFAKNAIRLSAKDLVIRYAYLNVLYLLFLILQAPFLLIQRKSW